MGDAREGRTVVRACYGLAGAALLLLLFAAGNLAATRLGFGIAATIAALVLSVAVVWLARRQSTTVAALRAETRRCEQLEEALQQAQKMEAVGRLTRGIAHDFNNHLTVISSNIELLMRRLPENADGVARLADAAMNGVRRAASLTQRLLAFSRQQTPEPEPLDAGALVAGMLDLLRRTLGEGIAVEAVSQSRLWLTWMDVGQLESALLNLAVEAGDAMHRGGRLTIETANVVVDESCAAGQADLPAGQYVMIAVASSEAQVGAFEQFFTTEQFGEATGLGLSMVHRFVAQSGGHARIESTPGKGTTIRLYLPRLVPAPLAAAGDAAADRVPGAAETVLVVEDEDTVRHAAVEALRQLGYQVLEAPDAMEAFRLIADRGGIDLLFTDMGLPGGVDGRALADAAYNINPALKVLFTTGYSATLHSVPPDGDGDLLAKPFTLRQLEAKVREMLDAPMADHAVPEQTESP